MSTMTLKPKPSSEFVVHSEEFLEVLGDSPRLVKVIETDAHEGPVYVAQENALYFTTLPKITNVPLPGFRKVAIKRLALSGDKFPLNQDHLSVIREDANAANGMTLDHNGNLIICEQGSRSEHGSISRINLKTGKLETVVDHWRGLRFNSPNDVVVKSDGTVWFTDPSYGYLQGFKPEPMAGSYVYRHDPKTSQTTVVADSFNKPNGLAFSPDESTLYITDSGANQEQGSYYPHLPHHIRAFDLKGGKQLINDRLFAVTTPGFPDGIKVDAQGRIYASVFSGVQVFNPSGDLIGEIALPGAVNFVFGSPEHNILYITTDTAIWAAMFKVKR